MTTYNGKVVDGHRWWATTMTPTQRVAAGYADLRARVDAASALLGMGLSVAAKFVLDESDANVWPSLEQARKWQLSQSRRRARFDGVCA